VTAPRTDRRVPAPTPAAALAGADERARAPLLCAPLYGVVHLSPAPGEAPFVAVGRAVTAGDVVCVIEAMKVFNEVRAEHAGEVAEILVSSGQEVDAGQPLLRFA
jgi:acetyl-CoA carboxylase biotin carboxyl carrier protein